MKPLKMIREELEVPPALQSFGSGWISGVLGVTLGICGLSLVLSLRYPGIFSMEEITPMQNAQWFRAGVLGVLVIAFTCSLLSLVLRRGKVLGTAGVALVMISSLLGGAATQAALPNYTNYYVGLDFFILNILFTSLLFVPLERIFPKNTRQGLFRTEWREDLFYYLVSSMAVQIFTWLSFLPANTILGITSWTLFRAWVAALPIVLQIIAIMFFTDLVQYWLHRAFHRIPVLWKFHAIHHSAQSMDWMAGARMHFLEILILRATTVIPMIILGFDPLAVGIYIFIVYLWSTFVHANLGWKLNRVERWLVTPRFHHWHHGVEKEAIDVNFSIHFPLFDRLFGTHHMPGDRWPAGYGIGGHPVPKGYWQQMLYPFKKKKK